LSPSRLRAALSRRRGDRQIRSSKDADAPPFRLLAVGPCPWLPESWDVSRPHPGLDRSTPGACPRQQAYAQVVGGTRLLS